MQPSCSVTFATGGVVVKRGGAKRSKNGQFNLMRLPGVADTNITSHGINGNRLLIVSNEEVSAYNTYHAYVRNPVRRLWPGESNPRASFSGERASSMTRRRDRASFPFSPILSRPCPSDSHNRLLLLVVPTSPRQGRFKHRRHGPPPYPARLRTEAARFRDNRPHRLEVLCPGFLVGCLLVRVVPDVSLQ